MVRELHPVLVTIVASQQLSASSNITRARRAARPRPDRTRVSRSARWSAVSTNDVDGMRHHMICNKSLVQATSVLLTNEQRLLARLRTPRLVQRYLNQLPYNSEPGGRATLRSFRGVVRHGCAHCLEAALFAAVVLEAHGHPPLVLSFESIDELDHVIFVYQRGGRWGSVARSRDPGLHGRRPVFTTARTLALSYVDPYVDLTGHVTGYAIVDLRVMGKYDWRLADTNVWKVERMLLEHPHRAIRPSHRHIAAIRARYRVFRTQFPDRKPLFYRHRERWSELPEGNW